jgi:hypothetical protein
VTLEVLWFRGCPHAAEASALARRCLARLAIAATLVERVGEFASPTILVDGHDVMGARPTPGACCRLDRPTEARLMEALERAGKG